jgi:hypothetical protein
VTLFKSSATAACTQQAAAQSTASNVQVFLTSTAIDPIGDLSPGDSAHAA